MKKLRYLLPFAAFGLVLSSCASGGIPLNYNEDDLDIDTEWVDYNIPATGVIFDDSEQYLYLEKGTSYTYEHYYVFPKSATGASLIWTSSDPTIASVDNGVVNALDGGKVTITVSEEHHTFAPVELTVEVTRQITDFTVTAPSGFDDLKLDWNKSYQFTYDLVPSDTTYRDLIWSIPTEEQAIAKIDNGLLTTYAKDGDVHLTVKSPKLEKEVKFTLEIRDRKIHVNQIDLTVDASRVEMGKTAQLSAVVTPDNAEDRNAIKYLSSDPSIASVDISTGLVTAVAPGTVELWANADGVDSNRVEFEVYEVYATALAIDKSSDYIVTNDDDGSKQLVVNVETSEIGASKPTTATVKYESNDPSVVSISESGVMSAHKSGTATITASIKGQGMNFYEDSVTVTSKAYITKVNISGPTSAYITDPASPVTLTATVEPNPHELDEIIWSVNPEEKVTKEVDGEQITLTPLAAGPVTVTATSTHSGASATHTVSFNIKNADYTLAGDFNNWTAGDQAYGLKKVEDNPVHYRISGVNLVKGQGVKVVDELKTHWYANESEYEGCGYTLVDDGYGGKNMALDHTGEYTIDFYPESEYGNTIVFTLDVPGEDPVIITAYYLVGEFNSWKQLDENYAFTKIADNHYRISGVELETGKAIKVMDNSIPNKWYTNATDGWEGCQYVLVDDGYGGKNVQVKVGGTYTIDFYPESEYGNHIIFTNGDVPPGPGPDPEYDYTWYLEGSITNWELDENLHFSVDTTDTNHYYIADVELEFGDELKAYDPSTDTWLGVTSTLSGKWYKGNADGNLEVTEAGTYYVNLYITGGDDHLDIWKDVPAEPSAYYLKGTFNDWTLDEDYRFETDPSNDNHFILEDIVMTKDDTMKVFEPVEEGDDNWYTNESTWPDCGFTLDGEGNIVVSEFGTYKVEFYVESDYNNHVVITKTSGGGDTPVDPPAPTADVYYLKGTFNSWTASDEYKFTVDSSDDNHYSLEGVEIAATNTMKVFKPVEEGDDVWFTNASTWDNCGFTLDGEGNIVVSESGTYKVDFYIQSDYDNHVVITKTSGGGDTPVDPPVVTEKVISVVATVAQTDGAWIALWAFKSGSDGKFYFADTSGYDNNGTWVFTLPSDVDTIIILRMASGAEVSDVTKWPEGKVWNQTGNITITGTLYTLTSIMDGSWTA